MAVTTKQNSQFVFGGIYSGAGLPATSVRNLKFYNGINSIATKSVVPTELFYLFYAFLPTFYSYGAFLMQFIMP